MDKKKGRQNHKTYAKTAYFIGIKGVGMTMLAQFMKSKGWKVEGSDIKDVFLTDKVLAKAGIDILSPFTPDNLPVRSDLIVYSSAYNPDNNPELRFVFDYPKRFRGSKVFNYAVALADVFNRHKGIAVCGSHGKTTTTAWLGYVLWKSGLSPNVLVGSRVPQWQGSSLKGTSSYLIAEADEYQNKLRYFSPQGIILNNIDYDHPDFFKSRAAYLRAFKDFISRLPDKGFLVYNASDRNISKILIYCSGQMIGYDIVDAGEVSSKDKLRADYLAYDIKPSSSGHSFKLLYKGRNVGEFRISLWGRHNILNALSVIAAARRLRTPWGDIKKHLKSFKGTERRNQLLGKFNGASIIDDYAHHPTEVKATLQALREHFPDKRIVGVFHPHTFTRTKALLSDFSKSFMAADELIVLDIYGSAREEQGGVSSRDLVSLIKDFNKVKGYSQDVRHIAEMDKALLYLSPRLGKDDVLVLLGAGDVFRLGQSLLSLSREKSSKKVKQTVKAKSIKKK